MRKLTYPFTVDIERKTFLNKYFDKISSKISNHVEICKEIKNIDTTWDLRKLLTADLDDLLNFAKKFPANDYDKLKKYFKTGADKSGYLYTDLQRTITDFFIMGGINIKSCFYCNIEYVNSFKEDFSSIEEFINFSQWKQLENIIGKTKADKISKKRKLGFILESDLKNLITIEDLTLLKLALDKKIDNEHFTLDHILPKKEYTYLSISFFNFIPCCSSCNSKFKLSKEFKINDDLKKIVPNSKDYNFDKLVSFKIKYLNNNSKIDQIEDLDINLTNLSSIESVDEFIGMFKLQSRYKFHKNISYEMINKRKIYSDSQIKEISKLLNRDEQSIKKDIFGTEIFESTNAPFEKYKQDIAKQLGII